MSDRGRLLRHLGELFVEPREVIEEDLRVGAAIDGQAAREMVAGPPAAAEGEMLAVGSGVVPLLSCVVGMRPASAASYVAELLAAALVPLNEDREVVLISQSAPGRHARATRRRGFPTAVSNRAASLGLAAPLRLARDAAVSVLRPPLPEEGGDTLAVFLEMLGLLAVGSVPIVWDVSSGDVPFLSSVLSRADAILLVESGDQVPTFAQLVANEFAARWSRPIIVRAGDDALETERGEASVCLPLGRRSASLLGAAAASEARRQIEVLVDMCCRRALCR